MSEVIVIGAGAAGMMAAISAADCGHKVLVLEKNEKPGKKLYITGKGRCNVTNACDAEDYFGHLLHNPKFMYSGYYGFDSRAVMDFFEDEGVPLKVERGERVFPQSDKSADILDALKRAMKNRGVTLRYRTKVQKILEEDGRACGVQLEDGRNLKADAVILATGGKSYPQTGSDGDGYRMAAKAGHGITTLRPALVPLIVSEEWVRTLQGLSLKNVSLRAVHEGKTFFEEQGEMMFTHFGITGPLVLSLSSYMAKFGYENVQLYLDMKPALSPEKLDERLLRDLSESQNKQLRNAFLKLLPQKMVPITLNLAGLDEYEESNRLGASKRKAYASLLKAIPMTVTGTRGFKEAIITSGGIDCKEINPSTMESRILKKLYFAGEIIDVDALTGGFNLQIAWSTGVLAGRSIE